MRIRKVRTEAEFDGLIDDYITQGYTVRDRGEKTARVVKRNGGKSVVVHLFLVLLTWGIGNLIYYFAAPKDEVLVRID